VTYIEPEERAAIISWYRNAASQLPIRLAAN